MKNDKLDDLVDGIIAEFSEGWDEDEGSRELTRARVRFSIQKYAEEQHEPVA